MSDELKQGFAWLFAVLGAAFVLGSSTYASVVARDAAATAKDTVTRLTSESTERRSQTCATFETQYVEEVRKVRDTYAYVAGLPQQDRTSFLNRTIVKAVPEIERNARSESDASGVKVPAFCNERGVGLPEPSPPPPSRPAIVTMLLREVNR